MEEIVAGVVHWTARHPKIGIEVSSYWLEGAGVLFDPLVPPGEGLEWFASRTVAPAAIVLSNRHHYRESGRFVERFGCPVYCNRAGMHEFSDGEPVEPFDIGEMFPGGVVACALGAICPDETALHIADCNALVIADGVVKGGEYGGDGPLGFVPDSLMDDPEETKRGLLEGCSRLLDELYFEHLLLAHGGPVVGDGRALLQDLVDSGGRTAFEM
jgi:hypothetical protein